MAWTYAPTQFRQNGRHLSFLTIILTWTASYTSLKMWWIRQRSVTFSNRKEKRMMFVHALQILDPQCAGNNYNFVHKTRTGFEWWMKRIIGRETRRFDLKHTEQSSRSCTWTLTITTMASAIPQCLLTRPPCLLCPRAGAVLWASGARAVAQEDSRRAWGSPSRRVSAPTLGQRRFRYPQYSRAPVTVRRDGGDGQQGAGDARSGKRRRRHQGLPQLLLRRASQRLQERPARARQLELQGRLHPQCGEPSLNCLSLLHQYFSSRSSFIIIWCLCRNDPLPSDGSSVRNTSGIKGSSNMLIAPYKFRQQSVFMQNSATLQSPYETYFTLQIESPPIFRVHKNKSFFGGKSYFEEEKNKGRESRYFRENPWERIHFKLYVLCQHYASEWISLSVIAFISLHKSFSYSWYSFKIFAHIVRSKVCNQLQTSLSSHR